MCTARTHALVLQPAGIWHCGETVIKEEGVRALWKGLTPFATHLTLKYALRMGTNATFQTLLRDEVSLVQRIVHTNLSV
jgi:Mitochondrial carrier protein